MTAAPPDSRCNAAERELRLAYAELRRKARPEYRNPPADDCWRRAAARLLRGGGDPSAYALWAFDRFASRFGDCYVNQFCSTKVIDAFLDEAESRFDSLKLRIRLDADSLKHRLARGDRLREILEDPHADLDPVFRWATARSEGLEETEKRLRPEAQARLRWEPAYRKILGKWLPKEGS